MDGFYAAINDPVPRSEDATVLWKFEGSINKSGIYLQPVSIILTTETYST